MSEINGVTVTNTFTHHQRIPGEPYQSIPTLKKNSGLAEYYLRQLLKKGLLPGFYIGNRFMVDVLRFEEYLDTLTNGGTKDEQ